MAMAAALILVALWASVLNQAQFRRFCELKAEGEARAAIRAFFIAASLALAQSLLTATAVVIVSGVKP